MNRLALLALALLATTASALQATTTANANLRSAPTASSKVLSVIPRATKLDSGLCTDWCPVTYGSQRGYVSKTLLRITPSPIVFPAPAITGDTYTNVDGLQIQRPVMSDTVPVGASAKCNDGSCGFSTHQRGTCSHHGGVASWM